MFEEKGMKISVVSEENIKAFQEKVKVVYEEYEPIMGKELIDLFRN